MHYDKDEIKEQLTIDDIFLLLESMNAEPQLMGDYIVSKTVCHNGEGEGSHKLYYYDNSQMFNCYTSCQDAFDVFELVCKVKNIDFNTSIFYVVHFFNLHHKLRSAEEALYLEDEDYFRRIFSSNKEEQANKEKINLEQIDGAIINNYPQPRLLDWEKEYISEEVCHYMNIRYNPNSGGILIPHYDEDGRMIGIRERTLVKENEARGKYRPALINGKLYNHPLGFNLYGLDKAKDRIAEIGTCIVGESEKAVYQTMSYLGISNNICVAMCGSTLSRYQYNLLVDAGAKEICIAVDRDYKEIGDNDYFNILKKMEKMNKYGEGGAINVSFMFDDKGLTGYKDSPFDCGRETFLRLWRERHFGQLN